MTIKGDLGVLLELTRLMFLNTLITLHLLALLALSLHIYYFTLLKIKNVLFISGKCNFYIHMFCITECLVCVS